MFWDMLYVLHKHIDHFLFRYYILLCATRLSTYIYNISHANIQKFMRMFCSLKILSDCLDDFLYMFSTYLTANLTSFYTSLINLTGLETCSSCSHLLFIFSECPVGRMKHNKAVFTKCLSAKCPFMLTRHIGGME